MPKKDSWSLWGDQVRLYMSEGGAECMVMEREMTPGGEHETQRIDNVS